MHQHKTNSLTQTANNKPVKAFFALAPATPVTLLKVHFKKKFGEPIMRNVATAPLKWKKSEKELLDALRKIGNKRIIVITNRESVQDTLNELNQQMSKNDLLVAKIMHKDAEAKKIGFNRSLGNIFEDANKKFGLDVLAKKLLPIYDERWTAIERSQKALETAAKTSLTINPKTAEPLKVLIVGCGERSGLLSLTIMESTDYDIVLHIQKEPRLAETGLERKVITFGPKAESKIPTVLEKIKNLGGDIWHQSGNAICSHIGEPVGHFNGKGHSILSQTLRDIIVSTFEAEKVIQGNEMPPAVTKHNGVLPHDITMGDAPVIALEREQDFAQVG